MPVPNGLNAPAVAGARVASSQTERLQTRPNYDWFYVHYPADSANWFVAEIRAMPGVPDEEVGVWWLPKLQTETTQPGINLHRTLAKGQPDAQRYDNAHLHIQRDGGIVLPKSLGYCVEVDCIDPRTQREGTYYMDAWSTPRPHRPGKRMKADFDRQRYHRWLLHLLLDGVIPSPDAHIVNELTARQRARVARRESQTDLPDAKRLELIDAAEIAAQVVEAATVPSLEAPAPKVIQPPKAKTAPKAPPKKKG